MVVTVTTGTCLDLNGETDILCLGGINRLKRSRADAGGKGINVARVCRSLGVPVKAVAVIGGSIGRHIRSELVSEGLDMEFIEASGESRINVKVREAAGLETAIHEPGVTMDSRSEAELVAAVERLSQDAGVLVLSGSLARGASPDLYGRCLLAARSRGVRVVLDTSGSALESSLCASPDVIKPNLEEAEALINRRLFCTADRLVAARDLANLGADTVLLTLGADGAVAFSKENGLFVCRPPEVEVLHTIGCGDSFLGGFVTGMVRGLRFDDSLRLACACGAAAAISHRVARVNQSDVDRLTAEVAVEQVFDPAQ